MLVSCCRHLSVALQPDVTTADSINPVSTALQALLTRSLLAVQ